MLITVVKNQLHRAVHHIQELVAIWMDLAAMGSGTFDSRDRADCVTLDPLRRSRRSRRDGNRPVASDVRDAPFEVDG